MRLLSLELSGFKSFAKKTTLLFESQVTSIVGPNGSGKSNVAEAFRWVLGEQSLKSLRGKRGEDLIFNGGGGHSQQSKASATVVFDNRDKRLAFDFDEVAITRSVYRDGTNEYKINNSVVRLKDVLELLSGVSLGPSGHHIISQGEADRILNASLKERREMIEEALGLKAYQWKIEESERKLAKTEENIRQVESLRREIAPHIKFLKKQVEKIEKIDELRRDLKKKYLDYFIREDDYLKSEQAEINSRRAKPEAELAGVINKLAQVENLLASPDEVTKDKMQALATADRTLREMQSQKDELARSLGRLEGMIEIRSEEKPLTEGGRSVPFGEIKDFTGRLAESIVRAEEAGDFSVLKNILGQIKVEIKSFVDRFREAPAVRDNQVALSSLVQEKEEATRELGELEARELNLREERKNMASSLEAGRERLHGAERERYELRAQKSEWQAVLHDLSAREQTLTRERENFTKEIAEARVLVDSEVADFRRLVPLVPDMNEARDAQYDRLREIEKIKIRLEDMGVETGDVLEEYKEVTDRDLFLEKELVDLHQSADSLQKIMAELKEKLTVEFKEGIDKINKEFSNYFTLMFGGGTAELKVVAQPKRRSLADEILEGTNLGEYAETAKPEEGIDIGVSLPRKKVKGLVMMSGGERALTSIALLFAMSQVNPPPFIILDETDAALDEANSRKYGDMIERLAKESQLILITHNRETMSRAGVLYGVTMGADGVSKLLSIKFDEAASTFAK
ncbi:MAG: hypothetical protein A2571_03375 [Candidatus Vogelbacteria bacterium RIFOXYD1_FULL_44_32]|uniref:RecF/RecN/SMC N-terminal domain-containing protein n=1 Tax=Candidatus Vogelbacteria bacterium RIFOXYD1_FULL_44_32 TaxID=1802438 RepID=A0A1G2QCH4_9BACT|nr:MAG: hypothetical protein A2571_03375 [Candidatus Vogelbacteria bacterium RIFOXYD1_FULL_44_32]